MNGNFEIVNDEEKVQEMKEILGKYLQSDLYQKIKQNKQFIKKKLKSDKFREKHAGNTVVVLDEKVIVSKNFGKFEELEEFHSFFKKLQDKYGKEKMKECYMQYIPEENEIIII